MQVCFNEPAIIYTTIYAFGCLDKIGQIAFLFIIR